LTASLLDAETDHRAYLSTGDESYVEPLDAALREGRSALATLLRLTAGDVTQHARLDTLNTLIEAKFAELHRSVELRRKEGAEAALAAIRTEELRRLTAQSRAVLRAMESEGRALLAKRTQEAEAQATRMRWVLGLGSGSLLMLLAAGGSVIERDSRSRERTRQAVIQSEDRLRLALDAANAGTWEWDLATNENAWSEELWRLYGLEPYSRTPSYDLWRECLHPDDRANTEQVVAQAARTEAELIIEFRVRDLDGKERWLLSRGRPLRDRHGRAVRYVGIVVDITERKQAEEGARAREQDLRRFAEVAPVAIAMFDGEMRYLAASQRFREEFSLGDQQLVGRSHYDVFPEIPDHWRQVHRRCLAGAVEGHPGELFLRSDGTEQWTRWEIQPWRRADNEIGGLVLFTEDITRQKHSEQDLLEKERRLNEAQQNAHIGSWRHLPDGSLTWSDQMYELYQVPRDVPPTYDAAMSVVHPDDRAGDNYRALEKALKSGAPDFHAEYRVVWPDGQVRTLFSLGEIRREEKGRLIEAVGTVQDVTERKQVEEALRASEANYRTLFESASDGICVTDAQLRYVDVNAAACRMFGLTREELLARKIPELLAAEEIPRLEPFIKGIVAGEVAKGEWRLHRSDGSLFLCEVCAIALPDGRLLSIGRDITERKRVTEELGQSQERLALAIQATQLGTFDFSPKTGTLIWSELTRRHFGLQSYTVVSYDDFLHGIHPDDRDLVHATVQGLLLPGSDGQYAAEYRTVGIEDGVERFVSSWGRVLFDPEGQPVRFVGVTLDVSERKRLEDQYRQAQKLESIGRLAGGVAHDFNNLLTVINGYSDMVLGDLSAGDPLYDSVTEIRIAGERAAALSRQLLVLSRKQVVQPKDVNLNDIIVEVERMLGRVIGEDIRLECVLSPCLGSVLADPGQLHQVLMNLAINARDAMPTGGTLLIETRNIELDDPFAEQHAYMKSGSYVQLQVSDTGSGMTKAVMAHLFEPFFTTKKAGVGTGLGLATVYGIVKQSSGSILVDSESGKGASFTIFLPRTDAGIKVKSEPAPSPLGGTETILVVEDQQQLRKMVGRVLRGFGYNVLEAADPEEALLQSEGFAGAIHLLLTDVVMPGMAGPELAGRLQPSRPAMEVVFMSGYSEATRMDHQIPVSAGGYLEKPFSPEDLASKVREVLGLHSTG
jgi:PAS domain S-box-containing protein